MKMWLLSSVLGLCLVALLLSPLFSIAAEQKGVAGDICIVPNLYGISYGIIPME